MTYTPTVSVIMTAFNHEKYIREAIESVLAQKDVDMEIFMSDDCSNDSTFHIMEEYAKRYPDIIKLVKNEKNLGFSKNMQNCISKAQGKYIAFCEGDDYWIDNYKLQKQISFLNQNKNFSICSCQIMMKDENNNIFMEHKDQLKHIENGNPPLTTKDIILKYYVGNLTSIVIRSDIIKKFPSKVYNYIVADWFFCILASEKGRIFIMPQKMSIYRIHGNNYWIGKDNTKRMLELVDIYNKLTKYKYFFYFKKVTFEFYLVKIIRKLKFIAHWILPPLVVLAIIKIKQYFNKHIND